MSFRSELSKKTGIDEPNLPGSYQILGDVLLVKLPRMKSQKKKQIAEKIMEMYPRVKTVCEILGNFTNSTSPRIW